MARAKNVAGSPEIDRECVDLARNESGSFGLRIAVPGTQNALSKIDRCAIGENVNQLGGEVSIDCGGGSEEIEANGSSDFKIMVERWRGIDENIVAPLD
jgi:hypothetical protein